MSIHQELQGKYELREQLGQGGMAEVWKAFDPRLERFVAIKFLHASLRSDPTFITRFQREARTVASLRHPNIVQVFDFETPPAGTGDALAYMVMDYIEGQTLADYLRTTSRARKFPTAHEIVSLLYSISDAIDYAHRRGLLHRDIKPANILLDSHNTARNPMGEPILTDFGIVKLLGSSAGTLTSAFIGTPLYISPEQAQGHPDTPAGDIYSLGVIVYEMCTGTLPFQGDNPLAILQQHVNTPPPPPERVNPAISPALSAVILRGLAKDPAGRFPSALAMTAALAEAFNIPLPERRSQPISSPDIRSLPAYSADISDAPTYLNPSSIPSGAVQPTLAEEANARTSLPVASPNPLTPQPVDSPTVLDTPQSSLPLAAQTPVPVRESIRRPARNRRMLTISLSLLIILVLLGSGLTAFLVLKRGSGAPTGNGVSPTTIVGNGFFTSSGAGQGANNTGINDTFQVRLSNIPAPAAGNSYYAWLLPDTIQTEANPRALGTLSITNGVAALSSPYMDPQQHNLVAQFSRFLVTEEATNPAPPSPSLDTKTWRYYAAIPQNPPAKNCTGVINQLSALCHLRHLISGDPELANANLKGGLTFWFLNNVEELQKWAREALDKTNAAQIRHKLVDMLYILDGMGCIQHDLQQAAPGADNTPDDPAVASISSISLLSCALTPDKPGYVAHIHNHLNAMIQSPGVLQNQVALASQIGTELNTINAWMTELQKDVQQLAAMDDNTLTHGHAQSLRSQVSTLASNILSGGIDANTGAPQKGAQAIADQLQQLATLDITRYTGK